MAQVKTKEIQELNAYFLPEGFVIDEMYNLSSDTLKTWMTAFDSDKYAALYGIGARLDSNPMLFFELRDIDSKELVRKSVEQKVDSMLKNAGKKSKREIAEKDVSDIFGL